MRTLVVLSLAWAASLPSVPLRGCNADVAEPDPGTWMVFVDNEEVGQISWVGACHPVGSRLTWRDDRAAPEPFWGGEARPRTPCEVRAYQERGPFRVRSAPVVITEPKPGTTQVVVLELPEGPTGGVGFSFIVSRGGMEVTHVFDDSPAEGVLEVGDLIVAVDGRVTAGMMAPEFIDISLGRVDTEVTLAWTRHGVLHRETLSRAHYAPRR
ncbi:MAG: hypothetical protein AAF211_22025 [Myxococcota bacterium]